MKNITRSVWTLLLGLGLAGVACESNPAGSSRDDDKGGDTSSAGDSPEDSGTAGSNTGSAGDSSSVGGGGTAGNEGGAGARPIGGDASPLPTGTLLYIRHETKDQDLLVALDLNSGDEQVVTDLTGDGSTGWDIDSFSLSPDRRRVALSSLYGPTKADTATGLATRAIWTLGVDGTAFRRLTPTFPKDAQGRQGFQYDVGDPEWTADGERVVYDFGEYWWEGTNLRGGSFPWIVAASGKQLPTTFTTEANCSVLYPSRNPVTGDFLFIHSVCVPGQGEGDGLYLYPAAGGTSPQKLVDSGRAEGAIDVFLAKVSWLADGSGFLFIGGTSQTDWSPSLLAYDATSGDVSLIVPAPAGAGIWDVAISPDSTKIAYCVHEDEGLENLHLIDLSDATPTDTPLTTDGKSCTPVF
jgi:Tol biopolymer transport system component